MKTFFFCLFIFLASLFMNCGGKEKKNDSQTSDSLITGKLVIYHAGSLSVPLKEVAHEFNKIYPDVEFLMESAGSIACARKLTELGQMCDIIAVSDYKVIDNMLIPKYCNWNIPFAGNEMIIAYTKDSKFSEKINQDNWYKILLKKEVTFGRSDPNSDPCGYRTVMVMQLADLFYKQKISKPMILKDTKYIRPKETDLLALLEAKELDYIFIYRSVAIQHHLEFLILPDSINLKKSDFELFYSRAALEINGSEPGKKQMVTGESMIYGISIPENAPNRKAAELFLGFLLSSENGVSIMSKNGQNPIPPMPNKKFEKIPVSLKKFVLPK